MEKILITPIGTIYTPYEQIEGMPIQPAGAAGTPGRIELMEQYTDGLMDLEGFSHLILLYQFHRVEGYDLQPIPFMDTKPHGVFATRAPKRPNRIGISVVRLTAIAHNVVYFENADMLNGSPLIDIKPFYPKYDHQTNVKSGWLEALKDIDITAVRSDSRFE